MIRVSITGGVRVRIRVSLKKECIPLQNVPLPVYSWLQAQENEPIELKQVA